MNGKLWNQIIGLGVESLADEYRSTWTVRNSSTKKVLVDYIQNDNKEL